MRAELKSILQDPKTSDEAFWKARRTLSELPRNSCPVRYRNRCVESGRPRGYMRYFGFSRLTFREWASWGKIPGVTRSSW